MGHKKLTGPAAAPEKDEDLEGGENDQEFADNGVFAPTTGQIDWCPICLNHFVEQEVAVPESCSHIFCLRCILAWAEKRSCCPIDRKPFSVIYQQANIKSNAKLPMKQSFSKDSREQKEDSNEEHCHSVTRGDIVLNDGLCTCLKGKCERNCAAWQQTEFCEIQSVLIMTCDKRNRTSKKSKNKINRKTCYQLCVRNDLNSFCPQYEKSEMSHSQAEDCTEFVDMYEISPLIRQKRRGPESLRLLWRTASTALATGILRCGIDFSSIEYDEAATALPLRDLMSETPFPSNLLALGRSVHFPGKKCALAGTRGGGEKKNISGASGSTNAGNNEASQGRRRSMRISKAEKLDKSASSTQKPQSSSGTSVPKTSPECGGTPPKRGGKQKAKRKLETEQSKIPPDKKKTRVTRSSYKQSSSSSSDPNDSPFVSETEYQPQPPNEKLLTNLDNSDASQVSPDDCGECITSMKKDNEEENNEKERDCGEYITSMEKDNEEDNNEKECDCVENKNSSVNEENCAAITDQVNVEDSGNSHLSPADDKNCGSSVENTSGHSADHSDKETFANEQSSSKNGIFSLSEDATSVDVTNSDQSIGEIKYLGSPSNEDSTEMENKALVEGQNPEKYETVEFTETMENSEPVPACEGNTPSNEDSAEMENKALVEDQNPEQYETVELTETMENPEQVPACEGKIEKQSPVKSPEQSAVSTHPKSKMSSESIISEQLKEMESAEVKDGSDEENHTSDCKSDIAGESFVEVPGKSMDNSDLVSKMSLKNINPEIFKIMGPLKVLCVEKTSDSKSFIAQQYAETPEIFMANNNPKSEKASENIKTEQFEMGSTEAIGVSEQISDCKTGTGQRSSVQDPGKFMENDNLKGEFSFGNIKAEQFEIDLEQGLSKPSPAPDSKNDIDQPLSDHRARNISQDESLKRVISDEPDHNQMTTEIHEASDDKKTKSALFSDGTGSSSAVDFNADNTEVVAMECDSPINDHQVSEGEHESQKKSKVNEVSSAFSVGSDHAILMPDSTVENTNKESAVQGPPEIELKKNLELKGIDVPRRKSRFHAATTTWSPERERKVEQKRSRSKSLERSGSGSRSQRKSRSQSRGQSVSRLRGRSRSRARSGSRSRGRSRSRSRGRSGSRSRGRSGSRSRGRSGSRSRGRSGSRSRGRSGSRSRGRSGSRSRGRSRSRSRGRSKSGGRSSSKLRGRSRSRSGGKDHHSHSDKPVLERNRSKGDDSDRSNQASPSPRKKSRSPSKERDKEEPSSEVEKREAEAERGRKIRVRSRSRSRSRKRYDSGDKEEQVSFSPGRRDRYIDDSWRNIRGKERPRMNDRGRPRGYDRFRNDSRSREFPQTNRYPDEQSTLSTNEYINDRNPDWVMEQLQAPSDVNLRENEYRNDVKWEENRYERDDSWGNRNFGWKRGRGRFRGGSFHGDQSELPWQNRRPNFSDEQNNSGKYQGTGPHRYNDHQQNRWRGRGDSNASSEVCDRSGWSSFSSWNARKTLPADVQNYYANRGRQASSAQSSWRGPEEEQYQAPAEQDSSHGVPTFGDQANQQMNGSQQPVNMMHQPVLPQPMNAPPQQMNVFPYPINVHQPPPLMHFHNPYIHPPPPLNVHAGIPAVQPTIAGNLPNSPPPPPPPPPPAQSVNYAIQQHDMAQPQIIPPPCNVPEVDLQSSTTSVPIPTGGSGKTLQVPLSIDISSSTFQSVQQVFAALSNSKPTLEKERESLKDEFETEKPKKDKKCTIQERAVEEVKLAIKPYYQKKDITKDEYKEIVRKAVDKVCHSKSGEVIPGKVANLVKAYVEKYKHARKGNPKQTPEECSIIGNKSF